MMDVFDFMHVDALIDALDSVTWYNSLAKEVLSWKSLQIDNTTIMCPEYSGPQLQVIWMICVCLFGDYGTSPRYGWIEAKNVEEFHAFIDHITRTYRENLKSSEGLE